MIDDYSRDLLRSGIIELKAGNRDSARRYLDRALYMSGDHDVLAEAWYWMSQLDDDPADKRRDIENCLSHDLRHARARRVLAILDGRLKPGEIINPDADRPSVPSDIEDTGAIRLSRVGSRAPARLPSQAEAQRFMCPKCGGRMTFAPDGQSLVCEYCTRRDPLRSSSTSPKSAAGMADASQSSAGFGGGREGVGVDFLVAMATARGHGKPLAEQVFHCQGCGAEFILAPGQLSITCPYCGSPHVVSFAKAPDLLAPDGILPHAFDRGRAASLLADWLSSRASAERGNLAHSGADVAPRGLYLPLWTFDLGGEIDYSGEVLENQDVGLGQQAPRLVRVNEAYPVMLRRLPIPASRKLSGPFVRLLGTFDLSAIQPYDPRFLADWPAELYDIPLAEASLDARSQGFAALKRDLQLRISPVKLVSASSARMDIESFRLNLVPVWMSEVQAGGGTHLVLINGQTGDICGDLDSKPSHSGNLLSWLSDLIKE